MNIQQAKDQIKHAVKAYFTRNELGELRIPVERQRPIFLMGPPGIGKTAIMEQIAGELGVGLVTYSMTHHTRQSALGLPFIVKKTYGGQEYSVSEYTMSEILASVYDRMEEDSARVGILFLDEINCVSETLAPSMLQFLQYKVFGRHRVPDGWIVVTAGNPPEYNNSVREFDIVTWDRLKRIDVEPDYKVWKSYAQGRGVHPTVTTYLEIKKEDFYQIETTVDGKSFVTARGWVDLSDMIRLYEQHGFKVDEALVIQYLQNKKIAKQFAIYYDLFNKYKSDYQVGDILAGKATDAIKDRARKARFDERIALLGLLLDAVFSEVREVEARENTLRELMPAIRNARGSLMSIDEQAAIKTLNQGAQRLNDEAASGLRSGQLTGEVMNAKKRAAAFLSSVSESTAKNGLEEGSVVFDLVKKAFDMENQAIRKQAKQAKDQINHLFIFCEEVFPEGQELLILVAELTANKASALFISRYGSEKYFQHNKELLFYERQMEIIKGLEELGI